MFPVIYIVDDDRSVRRAMSRLIRSAGMEARAFASAQEFLDFENINQNACMIVDIKLQGMSGLELHSQLRVLFRDLRTAYLGILGWQRRFISGQGHALGSDGKRSFLALEHSIYGPDSTKVPFGLVLRGKLASELFRFRSNISAKQRIRGSGVGSLNPY